MHAIDQILLLSGSYQKPTGVAQSTVSWRVFGDTKKLRALAAGADIQVKRWEQAVVWFSDNWPDGVEWPVDVPRPEPTVRSAA